MASEAVPFAAVSSEGVSPVGMSSAGAPSAGAPSEAAPSELHAARQTWRREARRGLKREQILGAAERLLVESGVERMRLRDVAETAGVSIGTVQHYFDTRDRLVAELFDWSARRRLASWVSLEPGDGDAWGRIETLLDHALAEPLLRQSRTWVEFLAMARDDELRGKLGAFYEAWRRPFLEAIDQGLAGGRFHPVLPPDAVVDLLIMSVDGAEVATVLGAPGATRERLLSTVLASARALLGVRPETGPRP